MKLASSFINASRSQRARKKPSDLPTVVWPDGTKEWRDEHNEPHREDGPAVIMHGGDVSHWYRHGKLHRTDGPAIEWAPHAFGSPLYYPNNTSLEVDISCANCWYRNGKLHREDGPAVEDADGTKYWLRHGKLHREDGPAIVRADGRKQWHLNGLRVSRREHAAAKKKGSP